MILLACCVGGLFGLVAGLLMLLEQAHKDHRKDYTAWDIERGRYVAALLAKSAMGDGPAASVVRPRPQSGPVKSDEPPKPVIYQEGM